VANAKRCAPVYITIGKRCEPRASQGVHVLDDTPLYIHAECYWNEIGYPSKTKCVAKGTISRRDPEIGVTTNEGFLCKRNRSN